MFIFQNRYFGLAAIITSTFCQFSDVSSLVLPLTYFFAVDVHTNPVAAM
jgi:hypothetical protein